MRRVTSAVGRAMTVLALLTAAVGQAMAGPASGAESRVEGAAPGPSASAASAGDPAVERAREAFVRGVQLVRQEKWAEALGEFERSLAERPHAVTLYNVALCHRALGRTVRAVFALEQALARADDLPEATRRDARRLLDELAPRRSFLVVEVVTAGASLAVDGLPVERMGEAWTTASQGAGPARVDPGRLRLAVEPGDHEVRVSREGHAPLVRVLSPGPGESVAVRAELTMLPGTLAVASRPGGAWLRLDSQPVGVLPLVLERPAGPYRVEVTAPGRVPFRSEVTVRAGGRTDVMAELPEERVSLLRRWWFWTAVGVVVTGAAVTTYALTRPTDKADGGSLGWVVRP